MNEQEKSGNVELDNLRSEIQFLSNEIVALRAELDSVRQSAERALDPRAYDAKAANEAFEEAKRRHEERFDERGDYIASSEDDAARAAVEVHLHKRPEYQEMKRRHEENLSRIQSPDAERMENERFDAEVRNFVDRNRDFFMQVESAAREYDYHKWVEEFENAKAEYDRKMKQLGERIEDVEDDSGETSSFGDDELPTAPDQSHNITGDEIEPDSVVMNGSAGRRQDESIEFVSGETGVLRLFGWSSAGTPLDGEYDVLGGASSQDDGVRFLVRIPQANGAKLGYVRLVRHNTSTCDDGSDSD